MKHILVALCLVGFGLIATAAHATDLKVACVPATKYEDGSTIPSTVTSTFTLYGGLSGQTKAKLVANSTSCSFTRTNVAVGTQEYYVTQSTNGAESQPSTTVAYTVAPPVPGAPSGVTVTVTIQVGTP